MTVAALEGAEFGAIVDEVAAAVRSDPLLVALGAVALLVILAGIRWTVARVRRTRGERFLRTLRDLDEVAVLMHPNPDPDAMACAVAVREFGNAVDTGATLYYPGEIRHQENRAFETVLDLDFERIETAGDLPDVPVVLVDHNEARGFPGAEGIDPVAVVDHHPGDGTGEVHTDVRADYGACATIFAEYFDETGWSTSPADDGGDGDRYLPSDVATGLVYGIQSDTKGLTKGCCDADFRASSYLYPAVDQDALDRIANPEVDAEVLEVKASAIANREVRHPFAFSNVGTVSNVDAIPQAADELLRLEGITAVVVAGERDGTIHLSGRSRDDRVHMGKTLRRVVEDIPMAEAGGHARMGGGQLSVEHMNGIGPSAGISLQEFTDDLFEAMAGEA